MCSETVLHANAIIKLPPIALETELLELFAPTRLRSSEAVAPPKSEHGPLWRADAIHRAKNMAQMTMSFANVADHPSRRWLPPEVTTQVRRLSRAYDELGIDDDAQLHIPCAPLLTEIVTRLADIFGRSRQVTVLISADAVLLPSDVRRALLLMGSELVINALKYAYSAGVGGTISVNLIAQFGEVELIVEDDGVGLVETYSAGHGGGLLEQLRLMLDATVKRTAGAAGHGFRVSISVPINVSQGSNA